MSEKAGLTPPARGGLGDCECSPVIQQCTKLNCPRTATPPVASDLRERAEALISALDNRLPKPDKDEDYEVVIAIVMEELAAIRAEAESAGFERGKKWQRDYGAVSAPGHVLNETRLASVKPQREG